MYHEKQYTYKFFSRISIFKIIIQTIFDISIPETDSKRNENKRPVTNTNFSTDI